MSKLEKIDNDYFEKKEVKKEEKKVATKSTPVEVEDIPSVKEETIERDLELEMKEFLKEKKVRGYALLRGESLKTKAVENGFTC